MTAISELRKKAREQFPGYPIEFDDGTSITLRSNVELEDETLLEFQKRANALQETPEDREVTEYKSELVGTLALVSDNVDVANEKLAGESLGILLVILQEYLTALQKVAEAEDAPKSEDAPKTGPKPRTRSNR